MKSVCYRIATVAGLTLFSSGCAMDALEGELPTAPPLSAMDGPGGHVYMNGLNPVSYQVWRDQLDLLMKDKLPNQGMTGLDPLFDAFMATDVGPKILDYAIQCALPANQAYGIFTGAGIMTTASGWLSGPLSQQQRNDVHTCIATRLNPYSVSVPLWGGGPNTVKDTSSSEYEYSEAVWSVIIDDTGPKFHIWPSETFQLKGNCGREDTEWDFNTRLCDNNPSLCSITLREDFETACVRERRAKGTSPAMASRPSRRS